jgi:hypothetical protein
MFSVAVTYIRYQTRTPLKYKADCPWNSVSVMTPTEHGSKLGTSAGIEYPGKLLGILFVNICTLCESSPTLSM